MLTSKQEAFCQSIFAGATQYDAYKQNYSADNMTRKTVDTRAWELMRNGEIVGRIQELRASVTEQTLWTHRRLVEKFEEIGEAALSNGDYGPANRAYEHIGKLEGLFTDKPLEASPLVITAIEIIMPGSTGST